MHKLTEKDRRAASHCVKEELWVQWVRFALLLVFLRQGFCTSLTVLELFVAQDDTCLSVLSAEITGVSDHARTECGVFILHLCTLFYVRG